MRISRNSKTTTVRKSECRFGLSSPHEVPLEYPQHRSDSQLAGCVCTNPGHTTAEDGVLRCLCCCGYLVLGLASGLEAFSREPPCDSIGALACRQTPETSGMAREFLSYYPLLPSRYLRDPFTISTVKSRLVKFSLNGWVETARPSLRRPRRSKNDPQFALREYLSQFPAK